MTFRDTEKHRLSPLKSQLFSAGAQQLGNYNGTPRVFCLSDNYACENLHASIQSNALQYFANRQIHWHDGGECTPSNHLCCSQTFCVNTWYPYIDQPHLLKMVLTALGYQVEEMLPFELDDPLPNGKKPYVAFEWIGERNYMGERCRNNAQRRRGQNSTSSDFAFRFMRTDGRLQIVLGEWKYTEFYADGKCMQYSRNNTDRLGIYTNSLKANYCQIRWAQMNIAPAALFYDPFDQLMRLQLLASEMENFKEMRADIVSVLHIAPQANIELINRITSPGLKAMREPTIHSTWGRIVKEERFQGVYTEDLMQIIGKYCPDKCWVDWMQVRYVW